MQKLARDGKWQWMQFLCFFKEEEEKERLGSHDIQGMTYIHDHTWPINLIVIKWDDDWHYMTCSDVSCVCLFDI